MLLVPDSAGGYPSRLADDMEATQLAMGADVLGHARKVLHDPMSPHTEVRYAGVRLAECLSDALRVAESRGMRLPTSDAEIAGCIEEGGDELRTTAGSHCPTPADADAGPEPRSEPLAPGSGGGLRS